MNTTSRKRLIWLVTFAALISLGTGLWFARARSWLDPAYVWVHGLTHRTKGGMDPNMPGMDMGSMQMGPAAKPSDIPNHAEITIPNEVQQRIGVTVGKVEEAPLRMSVRTVGIVQPNETKVAHIHLKTEGWVEEVFADYTGQKVKKGDALLSIYSPQFLTTQQEYLNAREAKQPALAELSRRRLELWDVPAEEIKKLDDTGKVHKYLTLRSPLDGTVLTKNAFAGQYITPQTELYTVADLSTVWVQAKVYEYELLHVEKDQPASVTLPALSDQKRTGKVVFVQPTVDEKTRTVQVRVELSNIEGLLRPGMFAHVVIQHTMGTGLLIPVSAVIRTGERDIAFRVEAEDRFVPVVVQISPVQFEDRFQITKGLKAGDRVVTSANFLIDSESRLNAGGGGMAGMPGMDMGDMKGMEPGKKGKMNGMDHSKTGH